MQLVSRQLLLDALNVTELELAGTLDARLSMVKIILEDASDKVIRDIISGETSITRAYKSIVKKRQIYAAKLSTIAQSNTSVENNKPHVYLSDCITWLDNRDKCDLLLTDPPYMTDVEDIGVFVSSWLYIALSKIKDTGRAYIFIGAYPNEVRAYLNAVIPDTIQLEQILVWTYKNTIGQNPKDRYKLNYQNILYYKGINAGNLDCPLTTEQWAVQEFNAPDGRQGDRFHTWQKPSELAERLIRHSTKPGDIIYDPFVCTGTFVLAGNKLGRNSSGCDISSENLDIAVLRGCTLA